MANSERPQLKSVQDLGMKPERPKTAAAPKQKAESTYQQFKHVAGVITGYTPSRKIDQYLTDAVKDAGKK